MKERGKKKAYTFPSIFQTVCISSPPHFLVVLVTEMIPIHSRVSVDPSLWQTWFLPCVCVGVLSGQVLCGVLCMCGGCCACGEPE